MPIVFQPLAAMHSGTAAAGHGRASAAPDVTLEERLTANFAADPLGSGALVAYFDQLNPALVITEARLTVQSPGGEITLAWGLAGDDSWWVVDAAGATIRVLNDGLEPIADAWPILVGADTVYAQYPTIVFGPTLVALFLAGNPTSVTGILKLSMRNRDAVSDAQVGLFYDDALEDGTELLETTLRTLSRRAGAQYPTQQNVGGVGAPPYPATSVDQDAVLIDCVYSGPSAYGRVWCDAGDVGPSTTARTRIPADLASNNVASYLRYPASFYRRPSFTRGIARAILPRTDGITTAPGALNIYTTNVDVVASTWLIQVDGVMGIITVRHDTIAGLRRPADIWNKVFVHHFNTNDPLVVYGGINLGLLSRLEFLEYAAFLGGFSDLEGSDAYTLIAQTSQA